MPTKSSSKPKPAPKKTTKPAVKPALKAKKPHKPEQYLAQPLNQSPEQVSEESPEQSPKFPEQATEQFQETLPEEAKQEPDVAPESDEHDVNTLAIIRKVLDTHEIMEFLPECYIKMDTAKQGDIYRLYLDDEPSNLGVVHKGNRFTVNGKYYPGPAEAAHALCDTLLAQCKRR